MGLLFGVANESVSVDLISSKNSETIYSFIDSFFYDTCVFFYKEVKMQQTGQNLLNYKIQMVIDRV